MNCPQLVSTDNVANLEDSQCNTDISWLEIKCQADNTKGVSQKKKIVFSTTKFRKQVDSKALKAIMVFNFDYIIKSQRGRQLP